MSRTIVAVGPGVDPAWTGRRVIAVTRFGGYAELVCLAPGLVIATPESVPDEAAASLPVNYLTAHQMLHRVCAVREGETVLVHGVAGGVGTAVVQLCRIAGARVIGTASVEKHDPLRAMGVEPIPSRTADWDRTVRELTDGRGVDVALDPIGGASVRKSYELLAPGGRLCCFGVSSMAPGTRRNPLAAIRTLFRMPRFGPIALMNDNRSVAGVNLGRLWDEVEMLRPQLEAIVAHAAAGRIEPRIDSVFSLEDAVSAHERLQSRGSMGKILLGAGEGTGTRSGVEG